MLLPTGFGIQPKTLPTLVNDHNNDREPGRGCPHPSARFSGMNGCPSPPDDFEEKHDD